MRRSTVVLSVAILLGGPIPVALADVTHVVQPGHTLEGIAHRYHVPVEEVVRANHLPDHAHLKPGQTLIIPGVEPSDGSPSGKASHAAHAPTTRGASAGLTPRAAAFAPGSDRHGRARKGVIHAVRFGEEFTIRVRDARGRIPDGALTEFARMARQNAAMTPPDPRLVSLVGVVSDHFGGRTIEVVSGYRAYTPTQYTRHSNHNVGKALDFRIQGVENESLRDFCRTLKNVGCGYYPNSTFVHLDARDRNAYWVDLSHPGEAPRYEKSGEAADESAGEVPDDRAAPQENPEHGPALPSAASPSSAPLRTIDDSEKSL